MGKNQQQNKVKLNMIMNVITWIIIWQTKTGKQRTGNNHINVMYRIGLVTVETLYITFASMLQSTFLPLGLYYSPLFVMICQHACSALSKTELLWHWSSGFHNYNHTWSCWVVILDLWETENKRICWISGLKRGPGCL